MAVELVDTHCHLNFPYENKTHADLVREAEAAGVRWLVTVGTDADTLAEITKIAETYPNVFFTAGTHPHDGSKLTDAHVELYRRAAAHPKCRAIGEIGLDYYYDNSPREAQREAFQTQLDLALDVAKPVVIHSRDAEDDIVAALEPFSRMIRPKLKPDQPPGIIHCFTGTERYGLECIRMGFLISFSGIVTFKTAENLRDCARKFPLENLVVETDSPFLAPIPFRGKKCEPSMVVKTAECVAAAKGLDLDAFANATTANARRVFGI